MVLSGLILLGTASANAADAEALGARVPFAFKAGGATLPPGYYVFRFDGAELPDVVRVRSQDGHQGALVLTNRADVPAGSGEQPKLVFEKDGSQYVLSHVFDPAFGFGIHLLSPRAAEPERREASTD
jgi:hypothetical protein